MIRSRIVSSILVLLSLASFLQLPAGVAAQSQRDADDAAQVAVELSQLESDGRASDLYRRLHPDARRIIPESAVVGWYETDFFPLDPQPIIEVTKVEFVTWTWPVTGKSYRNTAEVSYVQPFGSGSNVTYTEEIVRLVEDGGDWHWFFGRSPEFVEKQIARFPGSQESASTRSSTTRQSTDSASHAVTEPYSLLVSCSQVDTVVNNTVYAYCDWPFMYSTPLYCIPAVASGGSTGATFFCNPSSLRDYRNPNEVTLDYAPKRFYTIQVHCDIIREGFQKYYDCDWPLYGARNQDCVVDESRLTFPFEQYLLCKP